ncbi:MAG: glycoside hydrolase family 88 protein [Acidobacteria bacterium]|nr:glycoside hydrolase family 88 protein [Acidobacteriota bacterium]
MGRLRTVRWCAGALVLGCVGALVLVRAATVSAQSPDIFKKAHIKQAMLTAAQWQIAHPNHAANDWTNGAFYAGVFAAWETTKDPSLMKAMLDMGESINWQPGKRIDHADDIAISQTFVDLYRIKKDRRMIQPTIDQIETMRKGLPGREAQVHGITWWWCDALFMGPPTLAKMAVTLKDPSYLELNDRLFQETYALLFNHEEHLFSRDATYLLNAAGEGKREANGRRIFWSRGNGWVAGGLVRLIKELPKNHPTRAFYVSLYVEMMTRVVELQQADGLWRSSLLDPEAYPGGEASGSGFYTYALAWGVNTGMLDRKTFTPAVRKAWTGLNTLLRPDGHVGWVQPIGQDPRRDFTPDSWEVYGTGAFLLAGSEVIKLK